MHLLGNGIGEQLGKNAVHPSVTSNSSLSFEAKESSNFALRLFKLMPKKLPRGFLKFGLGA